MKVKALITDDDYVVNPTEQLFGDRIPKFTFPESGNEYVDGRAGMNYGAFLVEKLANKRATPILKNLATMCYSKDKLECVTAFNNLKSLIADYIDNEAEK